MNAMSAVMADVVAFRDRVERDAAWRLAQQIRENRMMFEQSAVAQVAESARDAWRFADQLRKRQDLFALPTEMAQATASLAASLSQFPNEISAFRALRGAGSGTDSGSVGPVESRVQESAGSDADKGPKEPLGDDVPPLDHRLRRDGQRDLSFSGWLLGTGEVGTGGRREDTDGQVAFLRGTSIAIYLTVGRKFVVHVTRWSDWGETEKAEAVVVSTGQELLEALVSSNGGMLGSASRDAWNEACEKFDQLRPLATEHID